MKRKNIIALSIVPTCLVSLIILLIAIGDRRPGRTASVSTPSHEQKMWCLAACAVLTQRNHDRHDILGGTERTDANIDRWMRNLAECGWGVEDRETLFESLRWIERAGHRRDFVELALYLSSATENELMKLESAANRDPELKNKIDIVREHYARLGDKTLVGWDYSRYLSLCRWGYLVGYVTEEEAWGLMLPAARILRNTFDSWEDLGANYLVGREFWSLSSTREVGASYVEAYDWLRSDPESPWCKIPWELDLAAPADENIPANRSP